MPPKARPSPSASATGFAPGTRMVGNDGAEWEVAATSGGVRRWRRIAAGPDARALGTGVVVRARLPVVLDDRLGARSTAAGRGLSHPTTVPPDVFVRLRRMVRSNVFMFEWLLREVPLRSKATKGGWFSWGRKRSNDRAAASLASYRLVEGARRWAVELTWVLPSVADPSDVDVDALKVELDGQLSDGWGEGVEQMRFGELLVCEGERCRRARNAETKRLSEDLDGRYSFNLTTVTAGKAALRVSKARGGGLGAA